MQWNGYAVVKGKCKLIYIDLQVGWRSEWLGWGGDGNQSNCQAAPNQLLSLSLFLL